MKVIIDCDPGVDDLQSIVMALAKKDVEIVAITSVAGNASSSLSFQNARKILAYCGVRNIPVHQGPLISTQGKVAEKIDYHGPDSLAGTALPDVLDYKNEELSSPLALLHYSKLHQGEIVLVALGPLTNLSLAYLCDHSFPSRLKDLCIMGADRAEVTKWNINDYAEFNAWVDPAAFYVVTNNFKLASGEPIKIIDYEFCRQHPICFKDIEEYYGTPEEFITSPRGQLVNKTHSFMKEKYTDIGMVTADPFAMYLALYPDKKSTGERYAVKSVTMEGLSYGHTIFEKKEDGNILLVDEIDWEHFISVFKQSLRA